MLSIASNSMDNAWQWLRVEVQMQVRVWGMTAAGKPFIQDARAVKAGPLRASIVGIEHEVPVGEVLGLEYHGRKGRFCVVWAGQAGTPQTGEIEIRPLDILQDFWGIDFEQAAEQRRLVERRAARRYPCRGSISIRRPETPGQVSASVTDISLSGCYIELMAPYPVGTRISSLLNAESISIRFIAEVRTSHPGVGMGVKFEEMSETDRAFLEQLIAKLATAS
jgi:PilZ domain